MMISNLENMFAKEINREKMMKNQFLFQIFFFFQTNDIFTINTKHENNCTHYFSFLLKNDILKYRHGNSKSDCVPSFDDCVPCFDDSVPVSTIRYF